MGFLSEGLVVQIELVKMPQWTKKILRRIGGKGTVTDAAEYTDVKAPKLMEFIEVSNPKMQKLVQEYSLCMMKLMDNQVIKGQKA